MPRPDLRDLLLQLREELDDPFALDTRSRELLIQVHDDIEECLQLSSESRRQRRPGLAGRLREATEGMQTTRPGLTRAMNHLLEVLAGMGF